MKGWPRYMIERRLASGEIAYYWRPRRRDIRAGFNLQAEPLGSDIGSAIARANELNRHLDSWRSSIGGVRSLDLQRGFGTLEWLFERYRRPDSLAWQKVSERSRPDYIRAFKLICALPRKSGGDVGTAPVKAIDARAADKIYQRLKEGPRGPRLRQAALCIALAARAWDVVARLYPKDVPALNPFRGVELTHGRGKRPAATREDAYALHNALIAAGEPHLAVAPLVCFEWLQRPENVIAGHLTWLDYKPASKPNSVRIEHHKTGALVWMPLSDSDGPFFPELSEHLDRLQRLGTPIVLMAPARKRKGRVLDPRPFLMREARKRVRQAADVAGLPPWLTLDACRHGGMTELADSDLTEEQEMSLSGHSTPDAKRRYVKRTDAQRLTAARKRRAWVQEQKTHESSNDGSSKSRNGTSVPD
ncbi:hypothetical protein [Hyphomicrobium sp. 1Nfss2.1]|uniref:hypothetical protein n=1 Tax=Hyphomicrobium sp. 1Nfss2.1 TaxID=3413936 RepID=UPI003C7D125A